MWYQLLIYDAGTHFGCRPAPHVSRTIPAVVMPVSWLGYDSPWIRGICINLYNYPVSPMSFFVQRYHYPDLHSVIPFLCGTLEHLLLNMDNFYLELMGGRFQVNHPDFILAWGLFLDYIPLFHDLRFRRSFVEFLNDSLTLCRGFREFPDFSSWLEPFLSFSATSLFLFHNLFLLARLVSRFSVWRAGAVIFLSSWPSAVASTLRLA